MDRRLRRNAGFVLLGLAMWGLVAMLALLIGDAGPAGFRSILGLILGLVALAGVVLAFYGLFATAWTLIRR